MAKTTGPETHLGSWDVANVEPAPQKRVKRLTSGRGLKGSAAPAGHAKQVLRGASHVLKRAYARIARRPQPGTNDAGEPPIGHPGEDMDAFLEAQMNAGRASRALLNRQRQY